MTTHYNPLISLSYLHQTSKVNRTIGNLMISPSRSDHLDQCRNVHKIRYVQNGIHLLLDYLFLYCNPLYMLGFVVISQLSQKNEVGLIVVHRTSLGYDLVMTNSSPWKKHKINGGLVCWENHL